MKSITFCIASANNEREYTRLLLQSLKDHTQLSQHEVLVFIDTDNQNTEDMLRGMQADIPTLRVCKNPNQYPIGSQRNVSIMFNAASNDVVCYLQSDMVVGKDFDKHLLADIEKGVVLSCARIEPPLHPASPEKIVKDFGTTPEEFQYENFKEFVNKLQAENRPTMPGHFAPFAIYKSDWFEVLGGFDTQFRCSREDSDTIIRMEMTGLKTIQSWNACVYHFTCVSSRGKDWFKSDDEAKYKNELQQYADMQELKRFIRKWGFFGHHPRPVYDIAFNIEIDRFVDFNFLKYIEPYCKTMFLSQPDVAAELVRQLEFDAHYYSNLRWKYSSEHWSTVKHLFNPTDFSDRIKCTMDKQNDVIISFKYSELHKQFTDEMRHVIENIQQIVDQTEVGVYAHGPLTIEIKQKRDLSTTYQRVNNLDLILSKQTFLFN